MTGYRSRYFRWDCDERGCYYKSLPDWDELIGCLPDGIRPTDIDGVVERNNHILILEEKSLGTGPPEGQRKALRSLSRRPGITTVFFRPGAASDLECLLFGQGEHLIEGWEPQDGWKPRSRPELYDWLRTWARHTSDNYLNLP